MNVREAIELAARVAAKNSSLPILSHLRFAGGHISATDLTEQIDIPIEFTDIPAGLDAAFCVHGQRLVRILKTLPDEAALKMSVLGTRLRIAAEGSEFGLNTLPVADFPELDRDDSPTTQFTVLSDKLIAALAFVAPAMAVKDPRYYLNGAHMAVSPGKLVLSATDGHRLHRIRVDIEDADVEPTAGIIPAAAVAHITEIAKRHTSVEIALSPSRLVLTDRESLTIKLIDGVYPSTDEVIPRHQGITGSAPRKAFAEAAERIAQVLTSKEKKGITIAFALDAIYLRARNAEWEYADTKITWAQVEPAMTPLEIAFSWHFITDAMKAFNGDNVFVHLPASADQSLYLTDDDAGTRDVVVMPMRI